MNFKFSYGFLKEIQSNIKDIDNSDSSYLHSLTRYVSRENDLIEMTIERLSEDFLLKFQEYLSIDRSSQNIKEGTRKFAYSQMKTLYALKHENPLDVVISQLQSIPHAIISSSKNQAFDHYFAVR